MAKLIKLNSRACFPALAQQGSGRLYVKDPRKLVIECSDKSVRKITKLELKLQSISDPSISPPAPLTQDSQNPPPPSSTLVALRKVTKMPIDKTLTRKKIELLSEPPSLQAAQNTASPYWQRSHQSEPAD